MKESLSALPCFTEVDKVLTITSGLSQSCFKVNADNKVYFAKTINDNTEVAVTISAAKLGLSPTVIYHDSDWLINSYIDANNLALSTIATHDKINHAIKLMVQCHQLKVIPTELSSEDIITSLLNNSHYTTLQKTALLQLAKCIVAPLNNSKNGVCCHGDLNFSNILINREQITWLVDYECACTAPIEYDLAMFIAVNNLNSNEITLIIEQYEALSLVKVDPLLLNAYLQFCYFINALWYFNAYHEKPQPENNTSENKQVLLNHAQQQWYVGRDRAFQINNTV